MTVFKMKSEGDTMIRWWYQCGFVAGASILLAGCAVNAQDVGVSQQAWASYSSAERAELAHSYQQTKIQQGEFKQLYAGPPLMIYVDHGKALMPPFATWQAFQTTRVFIKPGHCQKVGLYSIDTKDSTKLTFCYDGMTLSLDPSPTKSEFANGTLDIPYSPLWNRGFAYSGLSTHGYVKLRETEITVKSLKPTPTK